MILYIIMAVLVFVTIVVAEARKQHKYELGELGILFGIMVLTSIFWPILVVYSVYYGVTTEYEQW